MVKKCVSERFVYFEHLTLMVAGEIFIELCRREIFKKYLVSVSINLPFFILSV
jgi:hypothetical protein